MWSKSNTVTAILSVHPSVCLSHFGIVSLLREWSNVLRFCSCCVISQNSFKKSCRMSYIIHVFCRSSDTRRVQKFSILGQYVVKAYAYTYSDMLIVTIILPAIQCSAERSLRRADRVCFVLNRDSALVELLSAARAASLRSGNRGKLAASRTRTTYRLQKLLIFCSFHLKLFSTTPSISLHQSSTIFWSTPVQAGLHALRTVQARSRELIW